MAELVSEGKPDHSRKTEFGFMKCAAGWRRESALDEQRRSFFSEYPNKTNVSKIRSGVRNDEERE